MEYLYARDLDGTGSLHVCRADDPGAIEFVEIDDETREALKEAIEALGDHQRVLLERAALSSVLDTKNSYCRAANNIGKHIAALERLANK